MLDPTPRGWTRPIRNIAAGIALPPAIGLLIATWPEAPAQPPIVLRIDPNAAPRAVLLTLPRFGGSLADALIRARQERPFRSLQDLDDRVRGVGPATVARLRPLLRFDDTP